MNPEKRDTTKPQSKCKNCGSMYNYNKEFNNTNLKCPKCESEGIIVADDSKMEFSIESAFADIIIKDAGSVFNNNKYNI